MIRRISALLSFFLLTACSGINLLFATPQPQPTQPPRIFSPTNPFIPSTTPAIDTPTGTASPNPPETQIATFKLTPSPTAVVLEVDIMGCNTSLDITHGMGEVTNAFPIIRNRTGLALTDLCATLSASDEARVHPDKTACLELLPPNDQVILKLTVDTGFEQDTSIQVDVTTDQGFSAMAGKLSCKDLGLPGYVPLKVGIVEPIP